MTTSTDTNLEIEELVKEEQEKKPACMVTMKAVVSGHVIWECNRPADYLVHMHTNANSPTMVHRESSNFMCSECLHDSRLRHDVCMMHNCDVILSYTAI